jgi:hypothetical protein
MVETMGDIAESFETSEGQTMLKGAEKFAETLSPIGEALMSMIAPMALIRTVEWIPKQKLENMKLNVSSLVTFVSDLAKSFTGGDDVQSLASVAQLQAFYEAIGPAFSALSDITSVGKEIKDFKAPAEGQLDKVKTFIKDVFWKFIGLPGELGDDPGTKLNLAIDILNKISVALALAEDIANRLASSGEVWDEESIGGFVTSISQIGEALTTQLSLMETSVTQFLHGYSWYDKGEALGTSFIDGLASTLPALQAMIDQIAAMLAVVAAPSVMDGNSIAGAPAEPSVTKYNYTYNGVAQGKGDVVAGWQRLEWEKNLYG